MKTDNHNKRNTDNGNHVARYNNHSNRHDDNPTTGFSVSTTVISFLREVSSGHSQEAAKSVISCRN